MSLLWIGDYNAKHLICTHKYVFSSDENPSLIYLKTVYCAFIGIFFSCILIIHQQLVIYMITLWYENNYFSKFFPLAKQCLKDLFLKEHYFPNLFHWLKKCLKDLLLQNIVGSHIYSNSSGPVTGIGRHAMHKFCIYCYANMIWLLITSLKNYYVSMICGLMSVSGTVFFGIEYLYK